MMHFTLYEPDRRLCACVSNIQTQIFKKCVNVSAFAVAMKAMEAADRIIWVRLKICRTAVNFACVFMTPRAGYIVLSIPKGGFVKIAFFDLCQNTILLRAGNVYRRG